eukprot:2022359-Lingulodinium_polyedra.AAC.1
MRSQAHPHFIAAAPRISPFAHATRRPPRGGRRTQRAHCETRCVATMQCVSERISEQPRATTAIRI